MLCVAEAASIIQILSITIPVVVGVIAFVWRWQERQDQKINDTHNRTCQLESRVEDHRCQLAEGREKFEGVMTSISGIEVVNAQTSTKLDGVATQQAVMDRKIDELLARKA